MCNKLQEKPHLTDHRPESLDQGTFVHTSNPWNQDSGTSVEMVELQQTKKPSKITSDTSRGSCSPKANNKEGEKEAIDSGTIFTLTSLNNDATSIHRTSSPTTIRNVSSAVNNITKQRCFQQLDGEAVKPAATIIPCCDKSQDNITVVDNETCKENLRKTPTANSSSSMPKHSTTSASVITSVSASTVKTYDLFNL